MVNGDEFVFWLPGLKKPQNLPLTDQHATITKTFEEYQGKEERRNDLAVVAFSL
jgi:hypothetical protein